jgi:hypothetical protein
MCFLLPSYIVYNTVLPLLSENIVNIVSVWQELSIEQLLNFKGGMYTNVPPRERKLWQRCIIFYFVAVVILWLTVYLESADKVS